MRAFALLLAAIALVPAFAETSMPSGPWKTGKGAVLEARGSGGRLSFVLVKAAPDAPESAKALVGTAVIRDLEADGKDTWKNGTLSDGNRDFACSLRRTEAGTLELTIGTPPFSKRETLTATAENR